MRHFHFWCTFLVLSFFFSRNDAINYWWNLLKFLCCCSVMFIICATEWFQSADDTCTAIRVICRLVHVPLCVMVADSLQMKIWEGWGSILASLFVAVESDVQTLMHFGQAKAWAEVGWEFSRFFCLLHLSFAGFFPLCMELRTGLSHW